MFGAQVYPISRKIPLALRNVYVCLSVACQANIFICLDCIVKCILHLLELLPELGHVLGYPCRILSVHYDALNEISNLFHLTLSHTKSCRLWYSYPHAAGVHVMSACLDIAR